jgi:hypothetical protein
MQVWRDVRFALESGCQRASLAYPLRAQKQTSGDSEILFALSRMPASRLALIHLELRSHFGFENHRLWNFTSPRSTDARLAQMPKRHLFENGTYSLAFRRLLLG